ncbi:MAG: HAMP domain-containing sensor histidine kinase [Solirubrobacteraceae bacterium]
MGVEARLEALYRHLGSRFLPAFLLGFALISALACVLAVAVFSLYVPMSGGRFALTLAVAESLLLAGVAWGSGCVLRAAAPIQRWLSGGRPEAEAEQVWRVALELPWRWLVAQGWRWVLVAAIPVSVFCAVVFGLSGAGTLSMFGGLIGTACYPAVLSYLVLQRYLGPLVRDAGAMAGDRARGARGIPLRWSLVGATALINVSTAVFVAVIYTATHEQSLGRLGLQVLVGAIVTVLVSLTLVLLAARSVLVPVAALVEGIQRVGGGEPIRPIAIRSDDALGTLTAAFNSMAVQVAEHEALLGRTAALRREAARSEARTEAETAAVVAAERAAIVRELHAVVTHGVSVMLGQAAAADRALPHDPESARAELETVSRSGRAALTDVRHFLKALRGADPPSLEPQPGLDGIEELARNLRTAGVEVEVRRLGAGDALPAIVELSAYRIVQEGLTNVLKHSRAQRAWVTVEQELERLRITVADDGLGAPAGTLRVGAGILGIQERMGLLGGVLHAGPAADGSRGFVVLTAAMALRMCRSRWPIASAQRHLLDRDRLRPRERLQSRNRVCPRGVRRAERQGRRGRQHADRRPRGMHQRKSQLDRQDKVAERSKR